MEEMFKGYPDVLTVEQVQEALGIGRNMAYELLKTKKIKSVRLGKNYRIPKPYLIDYIRNETI
jgi:excisionase family DNA binding protein